MMQALILRNWDEAKLYNNSSYSLDILFHQEEWLKTHLPYAVDVVLDFGLMAIKPTNKKLGRC
ncbi:MAG: hypothetical protein R2880_09190 [Deinococcales bacterium]